MPNLYLDDDAQASDREALREQQIRTGHVVNPDCCCEACLDIRTGNSIVRDEIDCSRCGIEFGDGPGFCRRAKGTDICLECAIDMDPPTDRDDDMRGGPIEESPSYRDAMIDSGRWP